MLLFSRILSVNKLDNDQQVWPEVLRYLAWQPKRVQVKT